MTRPPRLDAGGLPAGPAPVLTAAMFAEEDEVLAGVLAEIVGSNEDAVARGEEISDLVETLWDLLDPQQADLADRIWGTRELYEESARVLLARAAFSAGRRAGGPCPVCETIRSEVESFSTRYLADIERGSRNVTMRTVFELAALLDVRVADLINVGERGQPIDLSKVPRSAAPRPGRPRSAKKAARR